MTLLEHFQQNKGDVTMNKTYLKLMSAITEALKVVDNYYIKDVCIYNGMDKYVIRINFDGNFCIGYDVLHFDISQYSLEIITQHFENIIKNEFWKKDNKQEKENIVINQSYSNHDFTTYGQCPICKFGIQKRHYGSGTTDIKCPKCKNNIKW